MKYLIVLCCIVAATIADEKYTDKYDNVNVQEVLDNERLFNGYVKCLSDDGPCTPEGQELKSHLQEALETGCEKCTDKQKEETPKIIKILIKDHRDAWDKATKKYDPNGKWRKQYEERAKAEGIELP